jgi:hypothetical protein
MNKTTERYVDVLDAKTGNWCRLPLHAIKKYDCFQLFEPDGKYLGTFKATKDAYLNEQLIWTIEYTNEAI